MKYNFGKRPRNKRNVSARQNLKTFKAENAGHGTRNAGTMQKDFEVITSNPELAGLYAKRTKGLVFNAQNERDQTIRSIIEEIKKFARQNNIPWVKKQ